MSSPLLPWLWVPSLYFVVSLPNSIVEKVGTVMFQDLHVASEQNPLLVSLAALPWALKPLWSPFVDLFGTKRRWVWAFQFLLAGALGLLSVLVLQDITCTVLALALGVLAFASATHDIAAEGFYLHALGRTQQSYFLGIRNTAYRLGMLLLPGVLIGVAGALARRAAWGTGAAWALPFAGVAVLLLVFAAWHRRVLPKPVSDVPAESRPGFLWHDFVATWAGFFCRPNILSLMAFFLFFRLSEAQLLRVVTIFLKDKRELGGLGMENEVLAAAYTTPGTVALIIGGILGGFLVAKHGLRRLIWPLVFIMHSPNIAFIALAHWQPEGSLWPAIASVVEQFGYGLGYTAFSIVMLRMVSGPRRAAHFAFATGFAYLGMLLPGLGAGYLLAALGYEKFFCWVMLCTLPGFWVTAQIMKTYRDEPAEET
jgi:PAT family beta-lactamase induction signal transducer AmpG